MEQYVTELYTFTMEAYKIPSTSYKFHASILNQVWQRIMQESQSIKVACQTKIDEMVNSIIQCYLEENIRQEGNIPGSGSGL